MGLYLANAAFWLAGASRPALTVPALWALLIFMSGLAAGRILSVALDGTPNPLFLGFIAVELVLAGLAWRALSLSSRA